MTNIDTTAAQLPARARDALLTLVRVEGGYRDHVVARWQINGNAANMLVKRGLLTKRYYQGDPAKSMTGYQLTDDGFEVFTALVAYTPERHALLARMAKGFDGGVMYSRKGGHDFGVGFEWMLDYKPFDDASHADDLMAKGLIRVQGVGGHGFMSANPTLTVDGEFVLMLWNEQHPA